MSFFKFDEDDLFINTVETYPEFSYYIHSGTVYINNHNYISGVNTDNITGVPKSFISLYEYNIDRPAGNNIYPFVIKSGMNDCFKTVGTASYNTQYQYGDTIASSYNMSASITRYYYSQYVTASTPTAEPSRVIVNALKNNFNHYSVMSPHYKFSSSLGDKQLQPINLISIPTILYGSKIKKGSVNLKYFITGSLIGQLSDESRNGELVQIGPEGSTGSGSIAGVVLYNEGVIALTASWNLDNRDGTAGANPIAYDRTGNSTWLQYGYGAPQPAGHGNSPHYTGSLRYDEDTTLSASYLLEYSGTVNVQTMTMFAHAKYGELNHSNNPTFISSSDSKMVSTGSHVYIEQDKEIKNVVYSTFTDVEPQFKKVTYISKVGIYDEDENLIGIAKVATPVRKTENHQYTFKLKLDI